MKTPSARIRAITTILVAAAVSGGLVVVGEPAIGGTPGSPRACLDRASTTNNSKWARPYRWRFEARSTPSEIGRADAERALRQATWNITASRNPCRMLDKVAARATYLGRTRVAPNIGADSACTKPDGKSVVGFGSLAPDDLGRACWWTRNGRTVEADIKLNSATFDWAVKIPALCLNRWSVEGVATHEFGHVFGLDHVSEAEHGNLTMSELILPCQKSEVSLGRGDVLGLRAKY